MVNGEAGDEGKEQDKALAAFGLKPIALSATRDIEVWPENWQIMLVFIDMLSQWNVGMNGVIGLRYEAMPMVLQVHGIKPDRDLFDGIRVMERAALHELNEANHGK